MNIIRCKNGHFYDNDTYAKCPHCGEETAGQPAPEQTKEKKKGFWGRGKKNAGGDSAPEQGATRQPAAQPSKDPDLTVGRWEQEDATVAAPVSSEDMTVGSWQMENDDRTVMQVPDRNYTVGLRMEPKEAPAPQPAPAAPQAQTPLQEAILQATARDEGKTVGFFGYAQQEEPSAAKLTAEPVVGWIACVHGAHLGECFGIYAGQNSLGRSEENRIVIPRDGSISRIRHAVIVYEPKKRNFYLQPGDSSGLTYLNEEYITQSQRLAAYDLIELGDSRFVFVPLCCERFSWEDYMGKGV